MKVKFRIFSILLLIFSQAFINEKLSGSLVAIKGIYDLREGGFEKTAIYTLNGEWEFYWNRLLEPGSFSGTSGIKTDLYGKVPSYWTEYSINGLPLSGSGFCTYRLVVLLPSAFEKELVLDVPVFDSSFKLFINGQAAGGNGKAGIADSLSAPGYAPYLLHLKPASDSIEIIIQVSNFQHRRGGFWKQMKIGVADQIIREHNRYLFTSYISSGILIAFSLFFFFFFLFYRDDKVPLLFSIFLAGVFFRLICTGVYPVSLILDISWDWIVRLEYLGMYIGAAAWILFMHKLYPLKFMRPVTIANAAVFFFFCLLIPFLKVNIFAYSMLYFQYATIVFLLFYLIYSFIAIFSKGSFNIVYFIGFAILFFALINDIILANSKSAITANYFNHIAVLFFVFMHAVMLIRSWIKAFIEKEKLNREIAYLNTNLESIIAVRTIELQNTSKEIVIQSEKIAFQNEQLKAEIGFKDELFSIIAHDLRSPIGSLIQFFDVMKMDPRPGVKERALTSIHKLAISAGDLVDNLLYWGRSQGNKISVNFKDANLHSIVRKVLDLFEEPAKHKSIRLNYHFQGNSFVYIDAELMQIILRNLISNAIKFTPENGEISISVSPSVSDKTLTLLTVSDNGIGISAEKLQLLLSGQNIPTTFGTSGEKGTGLGLKIIFDLIKLIHGKIEVHSEPEKGTTVSILLRTSDSASVSKS
jgi:signal transduction histidine kinase